MGRQARSSVAWGIVLPMVALAATACIPWLGLVLVGAYPALVLRIATRRIARAAPARDAILYATFCVLAKFPEAVGVASYWWNRARNRRTALIEYKSAQTR